MSAMKITIKDIKGKSQGELEVKFALDRKRQGHPGRPRRRGRLPRRPAHGHRLHQDRRRSRRHQQEAVAPKRHRSRARRFLPLAVVAWRWRGLRTEAPRFHARKFPRKTKQLALRKALSERLQAGDVVVVDDLKLGSPKTKDFVGVLSALELKGTALIVVAGGGQEPDAGLAQRCERRARPRAIRLNTYDVLRPDKLVFTKRRV